MWSVSRVMVRVLQITDQFAEFGWDDPAGGDELGQGLGKEFVWAHSKTVIMIFIADRE
ncbi:MAG: hypothetical protein NTU84_03180 [Verrucomicrobia bacterium]|jgi:hypothetical protein|nr:hypothetical protein [Verrucomicrobiota bacterium]